ncbi:4-hydroxy-tetrahydrodipicolinate synthase [Bacillus canaveralius]|uniref:4-hydroxy-tetrahydrodipicolinate synthase n=1 Tax=Bacillus canaveralius TaxID=1403243 RepID=A0A2N5GK13_9BACI|nr:MULTISPECIES: 4-hydroxy-tetrahydrodipicolinate synthase [Bacillus]PLR81659.1 4-hydroxy-tetrahydrodipicolinate synthase [Bacillus canaveralius]PLR87725.1 4-hydroxy-tetrahydrodipicolinate synthase [Bacillus sp. V33-4]PLR89877.1 4-hydroxy-tetrahydrodipicolinate synthase [Bacillus canaveralius]
MQRAVTFQGIIPPVSTIINENGSLDEKGMGKLIDFLIESGVNGLFFLGTGGEFSQMSVQERKRVAEFSVDYVNGRVPVLIGTGSTSTNEVIELSQHAEKAGADAVVMINPYYWSLSEDNLFLHYDQIAQSINLPILLYNFPNLTGQDLSPEFVLKLVDKNQNIVGIKETVDQAGHIREMILKVKENHSQFKVFCGFDDHLLNTLALGGDGAISASANFAPQLTIGIYRAFQEGNMQEALELHQRLAHLPLIYKLDSPFVNVVKEAMKLTGLNISTHVLPPARALSIEKKEQLAQLLKKAGLL